jgi:hypothetical protein
MIFFKFLFDIKISYFLIFLILFLFFAFPVFAVSNLYYVSDILSNSQQSASVNHTIKFIVSTTIPASGKIIITPESGSLNIPSGFDYTDMDFATSSSVDGPFADRSLASSPSGNNDGVSVVTGSNGSITITLNSSAGINSGVAVEIELGTNAASGQTGDQQIQNPTNSGAYEIDIKTYDGSDFLLDRATAMIAIVSPVSLGAVAPPDTNPPVRYNGLPAGTLPIGTQSVSLSLNTDEWAYCRYATTTGVAYDSMINILSDTPSLFHSTVLTNLIGGLTYNYYVRCRDTKDNTNTDDYLISFYIPIPTGGGGGGTYPRPPTLPEVEFEGWAYPSSRVFILKDGKQEKEITADSNGGFKYTISELEQGVYTFGVWAQDTDGRRSITDSSTFLVRAGTRTTVLVYLPPTIELSNNILDSGEILQIFGQSIPKSNIEAWIYSSKEKKDILEEEVMKRETQTAENGSWSLSFDTSGLSEDTYEVKARSSISPVGVSEFGHILYFGIGMAPVIGLCDRSDLNRDTRVNLVDFSILLYHWETTDPVADINMDGIINLVDFSIMLYCWTG